MDTKEKILLVAFSLFLKKNYSEVSINEIVDKVGLTKGAFYHHFKSKEQLFTEVIDKFLFLNESKDKYKDIPKDSLKDFFINIIAKGNILLQKHKDYASQFVDYNEVAHVRLIFDALKILPSFSKDIQKIHQLELDAWIEVINKSKETGEISSNLNDKQLAKLFINIMHGAWTKLFSEDDLDEFNGEILNLWMNLYNLIKT